MIRGTLDGVRVLDLSRLIPGAVCAWYLQGLGADVIKVEDPRGGDALRYIPPHDENGTGAWFTALHRGQRSVALDLKDAGDRARLESLLATVDVLVEGFRPGVMARLGLDPKALLARHPRLVIASISGFGQTGPWSQRPGHDVGYLSLAGVMGLAARRGDRPHPFPVQMADVLGGGLTASFAIAAALFARERTGEGRWLDVSMTHASLALVPHLAAEQALVGSLAPLGEGLLTGGLPAYDLYRCADDRFVALAALEPKFQDELRARTGIEPSDRSGLEALFLTAPRDHWASALAEACVEPVLELSELADHPVFATSPFVVRHGAGAVVLPPVPGGIPGPVLPAPRLGEHTDEILAALPRAQTDAP